MMRLVQVLIKETLLALCVDAEDKVLEHHFDTCAKNSKTNQNGLLLCVKYSPMRLSVRQLGHIMGFSVMRSQSSNNWEQLGGMLKTINQ